MMYLKRTITGGAVVGTDKSEAFLVSFGSAPHTIFMMEEFPKEWRNQGDLLMFDAGTKRLVWTDVVGNSSKLEGKTKAQVIAEARTGYETAAIAVKKYLPIKGKAVDSALLEGKNRASIITDARAGYDTAAVAAKKYVNVSGDTMTGNLTVSKAAGRLIFNETDYAKSNSGIEFKTGANQNVLITHEVSDNEIPLGGQALIFKSSGSSVAVNHIAIDGDFFAQNSKRVYHQGFKPTSSDVGSFSKTESDKRFSKLRTPADYGTGTANASTILYGDGTWKPISLHMSSTAVGTLAKRPIATAVNSGSVYIITGDSAANNGKVFISDKKTWIEIVDHRIAQADSRYLQIKSKAVDSALLEGKNRASIITEARAGKVADSSKLEGKTKAQVVAEARSGYETAAIAAGKYLAIKGKAVDSALLEGKNRASIITEARTGYETAAAAAGKYLAIKGKAVDSALLEGKNRASIITEARTGYETAAAAAGKYLAKGAKSVDSSKLEGKTKAQVIAEARSGYETAAVAAGKYLAKGAKAVDSDKLDGINSTQFVRSDYLSTRTLSDVDAADNQGVNFHYLESKAKGKPTGTDHALLTQSFSNAYSTQIASDWRTNRWYIRNQNNGKWGAWAELYSTINKPTAANVGALTQANADKRYLLNSGGVVSGQFSATKRLLVSGGATIGGANVTKASLLIDGSMGIDGNEIYSTMDLIIGTVANTVLIKKGTTQIASFDSAGIKEGAAYLKDKYLGKSAKAVDSAKLAGLVVSASPTKSTIPSRDGSGDIVARLLRTTYADQTTMSGAIAFRINNSKDNFTRYCSSNAAVRAWLDTYSKGESNGLYVAKTGNAVIKGSITATGDITAFSDRRLKKDIRNIENALSKVCELNGVTYSRIDTGEKQTGVIAQEVESVLPEAVKNNDEYKSVAYGNMIGLIIEAIKDLKQQVEVMKYDIT